MMRKEIIQEVIDQCFSGTMTFPEVLEILSKEKVTSYHVDFIENENCYHGMNGEALTIKTGRSQISIPEKFAIESFKTVLKKIQADEMNYEEFCHQSQVLACASYTVDIKNKQVCYMGRNSEEKYIENFPNQ